MMSRIVTLALPVVCFASIAAAQPGSTPAQSAAGPPFLLGPPEDGGPVLVRAGFQLHDINDIDDDGETFEFTGVLTLKWMDKRQAFDPALAGVDEKIYQGNFQFNEISPGWFPQEVLINVSGLYEKNGVVLRSQPDGTQILVQTVNAIAKANLYMRRFPFDKHRLEAIFELVGFDKDEVALEVEPGAAGSSTESILLPQWTVSGFDVATRDHAAPYAGRRGVASTFVVSVDVQRKSFFILRLIMFPLIVIVLLSFSVFWMDRSSLGDRINVSFIGILTGVAYQIVTGDLLPHIAYMTLIHAFLNFSILTMCGTGVMNLVVGALGRKGDHERSHRIDCRCRWIFPLVYFGLICFDVAAAFLFF